MANEEKAEAALREATESSPLSGKTKDEKEVVPATTKEQRARLKRHSSVVITLRLTEVADK